MLEGAGLPGLGPGPRAGVASLAALAERCAEAEKVSGWTGERAALARGAVLLWHDHLDAAHRIAQDVASREGSWLHGMMHRREPDYSNAGYWYQRVGVHGAFGELARRAGRVVEELGDGELKRMLFRGAAWNPPGFIDACERCAADGSRHGWRGVLERIQGLEFEVFLEELAGAREGGGAR